MIKPTKPGRANRIADQIQRDVAELIQKEVSNPKTGLVTLTGSEITPITHMRRSTLRPSVLRLRKPPRL